MDPCFAKLSSPNLDLINLDSYDKIRLQDLRERYP
jgi:hypothetical protein